MDTYTEDVVKRAGELIGIYFTQISLDFKVGPNDASIIVHNAFEIAKHEISKSRYTKENLIPKDPPPLNKPKNGGKK